MSLQGVSKLINDTAGAVSRLKAGVDDEEAGKLIAALGVRTLRQRFTPVIFGYQTSRTPGLTDLVDGMRSRIPKLESSLALLGILRRIRHGRITDPRGMRSALRSVAGSDLPRNPTARLFHLLYGAAELAGAQRIGAISTEEGETTWIEVFQIACSLGHALGESGKKEDLPHHISHFRAHIAIFYTASDTEADAWQDLAAEAASLLEVWGDPPVPTSVLLHAAINLNLRSSGQPERDVAYDLVRQLKGAIQSDSIRQEVAFDILSRTLGWREAYALLNVLFHRASREYYLHTRKSTDEVLAAKGLRAAQKVAKALNFCAGDGTPYLRIPTNTVPSESRGLTLLFPGGTVIGKTSVLCRVGGMRILFDYGRDSFGRVPVWNPEIDLADALFVSHAHQDHLGGLLQLYCRDGFSKPWYLLRSGMRIAELALRDAARLEKKLSNRDGFTDYDVDKVLSWAIPLDPGIAQWVGPGIRVTALDAGHVHGSCQYLLEESVMVDDVPTCGMTMVFSGDFNPAAGRPCRPLTLPNTEVLNSVDVLVVEGTNAFRDEVIVSPLAGRDELLAAISKAPSRPVLVPVLSLGRAQDVVQALSNSDFRVGVFGLAARMTEASEMPIGSNVSLDARRTLSVHPRDYDVLVASAGCLQGGPSRAFFERADLGGPPPTVLTGYLFPGTPARGLAGKIPRVRFSGHASADDWSRYVRSFPNAKRFLIHYPGERPLPGGLDFILPSTNGVYHVGRG